MKEIAITAKAKDGRVVGTGKCIQYDSIQEAEKALGKEAVLKLINDGVKTAALNKLRRPGSKPSLAKIIKEANRAGKLTPEHQKRLVEILKSAGIDAEIG